MQPRATVIRFIKRYLVWVTKGNKAYNAYEIYCNLRYLVPQGAVTFCQYKRFETQAVMTSRTERRCLSSQAATYAAFVLQSEQDYTKNSIRIHKAYFPTAQTSNSSVVNVMFRQSKLIITDASGDAFQGGLGDTRVYPKVFGLSR
jgi:hypothetical protein